MLERELRAPAARAALIARGAAQWCDPRSKVRSQARAALAGSLWSAPVIESALQTVLQGVSERHELLDAACAARGARVRGANTLAILPGNVIGPALACAYCAAFASASLTLKASSAERGLAAILASQFDDLGPPLAGTLKAACWQGGDEGREAIEFAAAERIVAFGSDATIAEIARRAPAHVTLRAYGEAFSIGYVAAGAQLEGAAAHAAADICMFDQHGCMSPQTVYVEGDDAKAAQFGRVLADALGRTSAELPRGHMTRQERAAVGDFIRRLSLSTLPPALVGAETLLLGSPLGGCPQHVVAVEPFGRPTCAGFGRIVSIKACSGLRAVGAVLRECGRPLDTAGIAPAGAAAAASAELRGVVLRVCELGEMQRPPLGYRPAVDDFLVRA
jgi:hypothetical protein